MSSDTRLEDALKDPAGHTGEATSGVTQSGHRCPRCGVAGTRYLRSTGRIERAADDALIWYYVTFCAACGHTYSLVPAS